MKGWKQMKSGPYKITRQALPIVFVFALAGCSFFDNVFSIFDGDEPAAQTASEQGVRDRSDAQREVSDDADTPSLTAVPSRPEMPTTSNRERVVEGLISDRENARYTDEAIRLQGSTSASEASQSVPRPAASAPEKVTAPTPSVAPPPPTLAARPATSAARPAVPPVPVLAPRSTAPAVQIASNPPVTDPVTQASGSVILDMSVLGGGSHAGAYAPVAARVTPDTQVATIQFNHSSARLSARDRAILATVASAQREMGARVLVVGHASSRTRQLSKARHEVANFQVSFSRANAVAQALIQSGVPLNLITVEAVADDQPIWSEAMPNGEAGNRRAEVFFLR